MMSIVCVLKEDKTKVMWFTTMLEVEKSIRDGAQTYLALV